MPYKILFVDDDAFMQKIYTDRLQASGFEITTASSVLTAKEVIERKSFDAICLDHVLSDGSGLDILKWIRVNKNITVPVIIFSASGQEADQKDFMANGANQYVQKDHVMPTELADIIKKQIESNKHE